MITTASLKSKTSKELGQLAKRKRIAGWHGMRKDELIKAIMSEVRKQERLKAAKSKESGGRKRGATAKSSVSLKARSTSKARAGKSATGRKTGTTSSKLGAAKKSSSKSGASKRSRTDSAVSAKAGRSRRKPASTTASRRRATSDSKSKDGSNSKKSELSLAKARADAISIQSGPSRRLTAVVTKLHDANGNGRSSDNGHGSPSASGSATKTRKSVAAAAKGKKGADAKATSTAPRTRRRIKKDQENRERLRDLTTAARDGKKVPTKDRIVLLVRDPYWLQAHWELTRATVERAQVALAEQWHTAQPVLRVFEIEDVSTTNTAERIVHDIEIHGEVSDWYVDVPNPSTAYRVAVGYKTLNDRFHVLARSNKVTTPAPGSSDSIDENWTDIAENCEKIFAMSGGYDSDNSDGELRELFEERLRRPMGSPVVTRYGVGADGLLNRKRDFQFEVDAEMIIYGSTHPNAYVTLAGEPVRLRPDGTFTVRLSMPDRRQVLPVVASSADGVEQHTTVLAVERNTKVMEPLIKESSD